MNCTVYVGTSLDGFIARPDGALDWLPMPKPGEDDFGYSEFMATVDAVVIGRNTFELVMGFGDWPYSKPVVVLTTRPDTLPHPLPPQVRALAGAPHAIVAALEGTGAKHLYIDGGVTIQRFLEARLITRLVITRVPVLIGRGIPVFGPLSRDAKLQHVRTRSFPNGLVQSEYLVAA